MIFIQESWKAVVAALVTAVMAFLTSTGGGVTLTEGLRAAGMSLLSAVLVWLVPNKPAPIDVPTSRARTQRGQGVVSLVCTVLGVIMVLIGSLHLIVAGLNNQTPNWTFDIVLIVVGLVLLVSRRVDLTGRSRL